MAVRFFCALIVVLLLLLPIIVLAVTPIRLLRGVAQDPDLGLLDEDPVIKDNEHNDYTDDYNSEGHYFERADILRGPSDTGGTDDNNHNVTGDPLHPLERAEVQRSPVNAGADDPTDLAQIPVPAAAPLDKMLKAINFRRDNLPLWESVQGEVRFNGLPYHIKGVNWFGFETDTRVFHGLDVHTLGFYLDFLRAEDFNLLRLPISLAAALDLDSYPSYHYFQDPVLRGKTVRQLLEIVIDEAGARGMMVLLDMHRARENEKFELWYTKEYSYGNLLDGWHRLLSAFKHRWNIMGVDLLNEPHGAARWESGDEDIDWNRTAENMTMTLMQAHPEYTGLFFVEGVSNDYPYICFWGANLEGVVRRPLDVSGNGKFPNGNKRVVYSPHTYGPSVDHQPYFDAPDYPRNLPKIWDALFGFVEQATGNAVVIGEWGGFYHNQTKLFIDEFALYLLERCMSDNIFWVLNPNVSFWGRREVWKESLTFMLLYVYLSRLREFSHAYRALTREAYSTTTGPRPGATVSRFYRSCSLPRPGSFSMGRSSFTSRGPMRTVSVTHAGGSGRSRSGNACVRAGMTWSGRRESSCRWCKA